LKSTKKAVDVNMGLAKMAVHSSAYTLMVTQRLALRIHFLVYQTRTASLRKHSGFAVQFQVARRASQSSLSCCSGD